MEGREGECLGRDVAKREAEGYLIIISMATAS